MTTNRYRASFVGKEDVLELKVSLNYLEQEKKKSKCHTGLLLSNEKGWSPDTCYQLDGPCGHDAQWERQAQDTQGVTPLTGKVQSRPIRRHSGSLLSGAGSTEWRVIANGDRMSFGGRRMFWNVNTLVNFTIRQVQSFLRSFALAVSSVFSNLPLDFCVMRSTLISFGYVLK